VVTPRPRPVVTEHPDQCIHPHTPVVNLSKNVSAKVSTIYTERGRVHAEMLVVVAAKGLNPGE